MMTPLNGKASAPSAAIRVGETPLLDLSFLLPAAARGWTLSAKAEWHNPGGSVKDRAGLRIVQEAERSGALTKDKVLLDATSGNTGIAYAWICSRLGYKVSLAVPGTLNEQRRAILQAYGVELLFTSPLEGSDGAIREAKLLYAAEPDRYFFADQYNNPANWMAHYDTTGPEIVTQTKGAVTHFVAGLGTSGTFVGTSRRLREMLPNIKLYSLEPDNAMHGLEGLKHMATAIVPGIYDAAIADEKLAIATDEGQAMARKLAKHHGLLVGPSGGANLAASAALAARLGVLGQRGHIVTILPDSGERYLGDRFWKD
jgi:S-sulfo-L-cysteine synthase (O-acetyl-L-serine-dependent)